MSPFLPAEKSNHLPLASLTKKDGRLLGVEGRQAGEFPALLLELHPAADDRRRRQPRADFVEEGIGEAHGVEVIRSGRDGA